MKKTLSIIMSLITISTYTNSFATKDDPLQPEDYGKIRAEFKKKYDANPNDHLPIVYELKKPTPDDNRLVMVYNMQHLLSVSKDENFIRAIMELYSKAKEAVQKAKIEHNT